jgi:hypothetical protein
MLTAYLLGFCLQAYFRRAQLKALVGLHSTDEGLGGTLSADEISIITGALDLTSKTAWAAMTPLDKVRCIAAFAANFVEVLQCRDGIKGPASLGCLCHHMRCFAKSLTACSAQMRSA